MKNNEEITMQQQGDVVIKQAEAIPAGAIRQKRQAKGYILAEGEATGHHHAIKEEVELYEYAGKLYLKNDVEATLVHEEHHTQTIPPGIWEIDQVREFDYLEQITRRVVD